MTTEVTDISFSNSVEHDYHVYIRDQLKEAGAIRLVCAEDGILHALFIIIPERDWDVMGAVIERCLEVERRLNFAELGIYDWHTIGPEDIPTDCREI